MPFVPFAARHTAAILAILAILGASACATGDGRPLGGGEPGSTPDSLAQGADGDTLLTYEERTFRREHGSCQREGVDSTAVPCVTVTISYPEVQGAVSPALADSVRAFVRGTAFSSPTGDGEPAAGATDAAGVAALLTSDYDEARAQLDEYLNTWSLERDVSVACEMPRVVSLASREYRYTGGAHGLETVQLASFDARTGRRLTLATLVADSAGMTAAAEREFRRQQQIPAGQTLAGAGYIFFDDERFALTDNFLLCGDTLVFHYNPYEIAPYALGPTELELPLAAVRAYLRSEWR